MKKTIRIIAAILTVVFTLSFVASCALYDKEKTTDTKKSDSSEEEKRDFAEIKSSYTQEELDTPVISIGKRSVSFAEYLDFFEEIYTYYQTNYGMDIMENAETLTQYIDLIRESLTKDTMVMYQADKLGLTEFTDEQKAEIQAKYDKEVREMYGYYMDYVGTSQEYEDDTARSEAIEKYVLDEAEYYCGEGTTVEEYLDYLYDKAEEEYVQKLLFNEVTKDVTVSEEDLQAWYDENIEKDTEYYKAHPETYKDECDSYELTGYISDGTTPVAPLYVPEGYGRILHILIKSENSTSQEYSENEEKMASYADEYGKLAFEIATNGGTESDNDRLQEILTEYNNLKKENQTELEEAYKDAKAKAEEAYAKLEAGEDFAAVTDEYTDDETFKKGGEFAEKGRLISTRYNSESDWSSEIKKEYGKIKKGEYSPIFLDKDGYHIIYHIGNEKKGKRAFADTKSEIEAALLGKYRQSSYDEQMETWLSGGAEITYNHELMESLTKKIG